MTKRANRPNHAAQWDAEFDRDRRVAFQLSHRKLWRLSAIGLVFFVVGSLMSFADSSSTGDRVVGGLAALMGAACLVVFSTQLRQNRPAVVVDDRGVTSCYPWRGEHLVPWSEILDAGVYRTHGTAMVLLMISDEYETQWLADKDVGAGGRALATGNRALIGAPSIALPSPLKADPDELAVWIQGKASERRPD